MIKFIYVILFSVLFLTANVFSQSKLGLGFEAGLNIADVSTSPTFTTTGKKGIIAGAFLDINISGNFSVQPGLHFISKGYALNANDVNGNTVNALFNLNYTEI